MTRFMDGYNALAETAERLLIDHGYGSKDHVQALTRYHKIRAAYFLLQGALATYDDGKPLQLSQETNEHEQH